MVASAQPVRLDGGRVISGIFGPARRDGRWVVPETLTVTAMVGEVEVDFTQAILQARRVQLLRHGRSAAGCGWSCRTGCPWS